MISVIVLTYNSLKFIDRCLDSIFNQHLSDMEVIAVDNGSSDGTVEFIQEHYPKAKLIMNKFNRGACQARNQGIAASRGDWILTLDCDAVLADDFFKTAVTFIQSNINRHLGMIQPKILNYDKNTVYSCGINLTWIRRFYDIGQGESGLKRFNNTKNIFGACSATAFYRREMLEDIKEKSGYFDTRLFFLVEDVDLSWRARNKKWETVFLPRLVSYHSGGSSGFNPKMRQYLCLRNRWRSIIKNEGPLRYCLKIFPVLFYDFPRVIYLAVTNFYVRKSIMAKDDVLSAALLLKE